MTGDGLSPDQRELLERVIAAGGPLVVVRHHPTTAVDATTTVGTIRALQRRGLIKARRVGRGKFLLEAVSRG